MSQNNVKFWNENEVSKSLLKIVKDTGIRRMPTHSEMKEFYGDYSLTNAVRRNGGTKHFADILGLPIKDCESKFGEKYESICLLKIQEDLGLRCELTKPRYPYDLIAERAVKVDVKVGKLFKAKTGSEYYTFNLEKKDQTCDIFVAYCINKKGEIEKTLIIPATVLSGKTQLAVGSKSVYDKYKDAWHFIADYANFMCECI